MSTRSFTPVPGSSRSADRSCTFPALRIMPFVQASSGPAHADRRKINALRALCGLGLTPASPSSLSRHPPPVKAMLAALRRNHPPTGNTHPSSQTSDNRIHEPAKPSGMVFQPCESFIPHSDEFFQRSAKSIHPSEESCQRPQESCHASPKSRHPSPGLCPLYKNRVTFRPGPVTFRLGPVTFRLDPVTLHQGPVTFA